MINRSAPFLVLFSALLFFGATDAHAALSLIAGSNATTTPNVATAITGFQIIGPSASSTPVKLRATNGTLTLSSVGGVTMSGNNSGVVTLSGTVAGLNSALSTLTYTRASTGVDTLEVSLVEAGEVFFEGNGHLYKYISDTSTWNAAKTKAEAQTLYGATGYLVTVTSGNENAFVTARLSNAGWMGASDSVSEGVWRWVTGPEIGIQFWSGAIGGSPFGGNYANWGTSEPNDSGSNEDCAQFLAGGSGKWNDLPCSVTTLPGYVAEFGAPGNMPVVVAQNISIVTADVPAINSLSPSNGSSGVNSGADLVIQFTKSVTPISGNILIKKVSDDSIFETIDVAGGLLSGGGTNTITINPSGILQEGVEYYVSIPNTSFKDSSDNFYEGFSGSSIWSFTTSDTNAPILSNIEITAATTTASIGWLTNEMASSRVSYGLTPSYGLLTAEINTSPRVASHEVSLSDLLACTTYHYRVTSTDGFSNTTHGADATFTTAGCPGSSMPTSATSTSVTTSSGGTSSIVDDGKTFSVTVPPNATATSSSFIIQIKAIPSIEVLAAIGKPGAVSSEVGVTVFDVKAIIDGDTILDSFDVEVTIQYEYTDDEIEHLVESSLWLYHYTDGEWKALNDCAHNMDANIITCTTPSFSIFGLFGNASAGSAGAPVAAGLSMGTSVQSRVANLLAMGNQSAAYALMQEWPHLFPNQNKDASHISPALSLHTQVRDLELAMTGEDVLALQKLLNASGFPLASTGVGSAGKETTYFGSLTHSALARYQAASGIAPVVGYFGPITRAQMKSSGRSGLWW